MFKTFIKLKSTLKNLAKLIEYTGVHRLFNELSSFIASYKTTGIQVCNSHVEQ